MLLLRHLNREYFVKYQNILLANLTDNLKYGEHHLEDIWRWVCWSQVYGRNSCKTHYIEKSKKTVYLKYGIGKAEYSSLTNKSFRVSRSHTLSYRITTEHSS
jgi:hypothetical protein